MPDLDLIKQAEQGVRDGHAVFAGQDGQRYPTLTLPRSRGREGRGRIWRVAEALEYGVVGIKRGHHLDGNRPFGGMKESGIGPIWWPTGARNTASRSSSKSNTSAWAASTCKIMSGASGGDAGPVVWTSSPLQSLFLRVLGPITPLGG